jgi:AraC family transcriptional regulator of adaptative response/methylated-DNA-[protein]-cysteine methyltransferase
MNKDAGAIVNISVPQKPTIDELRIARAKEYFQEQFRHQPTLEKVARHVNLSPWYFQRKFKKLTGVTPKRFLQLITLEEAKRMLRETNKPLIDITLEIGMSGSSRLHDLFTKREGMTPGEYRKQYQRQPKHAN